MNATNRLICRLLVLALVFAATGLRIGADQVTIPRSHLRPKQPQIAMPNILCTTPGIPDIVLIGLGVDGNRTITGVPAHTYTVTVALENRGQCETGNFRLQVSVLAADNSQTIGKSETRVILDKFMPSIQPSRDDFSSVTNVDIHFTTGPNFSSQYDFSAIVDPGNSIREFRENNNLLDRWAVINVSAKTN